MCLRAGHSKSPTNHVELRSSAALDRPVDRGDVPTGNEPPEVVQPGEDPQRFSTGVQEIKRFTAPHPKSHLVLLIFWTLVSKFTCGSDRLILPDLLISCSTHVAGLQTSVAAAEPRLPGRADRSRLPRLRRRRMARAVAGESSATTGGETWVPGVRTGEKHSVHGEPGGSIASRPWGGFVAGRQVDDRA